MRLIGAVLIVGVLAVPASPAQDARSFEVASIKPVPADSYDLTPQVIKVNGQTADFPDMSVTDLVAYAFHVEKFQIIGPNWMGSRFNILAKLPDGATPGQVPDLMAQLLAERFQMKFHKESKEFPVYALVVGPKGAKLTPAPPDYQPTGSQPMAMTMDRYARAISRNFDKPLINQTGLPGEYLIARRQMPVGMAQLGEAIRQYKATGVIAPPSAASDPTGSAITPILTELGLKAESRKRQLPVIVIDRIDVKAVEQ